MKQKYTITKDPRADEVKIQEFAELDKDAFSLVCEETYDGDKIKAAASQGKEPLIEVLRTPNLYPVSEYADKIAESINTLFSYTEEDSVEVIFDDLDALKREKDEAAEEEEEDNMALDDLLDEEVGEQESSEGAIEDHKKDDEETGDSVSLSDEDSLDVFDDDEDDTNNT
ncbi:MAG: hypothetical protein R6X08_08080 [Desulfosalsimonadaceae bacterium]